MSTELGLFLRNRRESVQPGTVGLPYGTRRRTPGLRRSELAVLAGISVDYLVRLEQGRDHKPSAQVLAAIADALRLDESDRDILRRFTAMAHGAELRPTFSPVARTVRPTVAAVLARLEPTPAIVINRLTDVLATTDGFTALAGPLGMIDDESPNLLRFALEHPRAAAAFPDLESIIQSTIGLLGGVCPSGAEPDSVAAEIGLASPYLLAQHWERRVVAPAPGVTHRIRHPVGELRFLREQMQLDEIQDQRLIVFLPADENTSLLLDDLNGRRPGALRAVSTT